MNISNSQGSHYLRGPSAPFGQSERSHVEQSEHLWNFHLLALQHTRSCSLTQIRAALPICAIPNHKTKAWPKLEGPCRNSTMPLPRLRAYLESEGQGESKVAHSAPCWDVNLQTPSIPQFTRSIELAGHLQSFYGIPGSPRFRWNESIST